MIRPFLGEERIEVGGSLGVCSSGAMAGSDASLSKTGESWICCGSSMVGDVGDVGGEGGSEPASESGF